MRKYVIIDKATGNVKMTMSWADDRELPTEVEILDTDKIITVDSEEIVDPMDVYDDSTKRFYVLEESSNDIIKRQLIALDVNLTRFQEDTWTALGIDEKKLPQIWQDRLASKRALREQLT